MVTWLVLLLWNNLLIVGVVLGFVVAFVAGIFSGVRNSEHHADARRIESYAAYVDEELQEKNRELKEEIKYWREEYTDLDIKRKRLQEALDSLTHPRRERGRPR